ncbi:hypothetical protein ACOMHN_063976 [Nucella lapillus]
MGILRLQNFVFCLLLWITEQAKLSDYILDFQPMHYDAVDLHHRHERVRRSVDPHLHLNFDAYGRKFQLKLKRDNSIFAADHMMKESDGSLSSVDTSFIYSGHLEDVPDSFAHIALINGTSRGFIHVPGHTTYHIEPATMYFHRPRFHTVIYPESHMDLSPYRHRRGADVGMCGNDLAAQWMKHQAESAVDREPSHRARRQQQQQQQQQGGWGEGGRQRRSTIGEKNTCYLYLRADPILWEHVKNKKYNTVLSDSRTQEEILAFFASHVSAVKNIYSKTEFRTYDRSLTYIGVDFVVQRTSIMTLENQFCNSNRATNYCNRNIDVTNFLNLNSLDQHDEFCLAYVFTFRDFTKGTLGLAWVGSDSRAAGGVCERHKDYPEGGSRVSKSLNTGIVTVINYGKAVPARVSQLTFAHEIGHNFGSPLTFAHEIGHNFGSPHDSGSTCAPYGTSHQEAEEGNYIMFASATMGDKANNDDFSRCSLDNITRVLDAVLNERYGKVNCFQKSTQAFCGNSITEEGEQCDCGYEADCKDVCCYGKGSTKGPECTLRAGKKCSPTAGPCCSPRCEYIPPEEAVVCQPMDDCKAESLCGYPLECVSSVCHRIGWEECYLTSSGDDKDGPSREAMCYVSCRNPHTKKCVSSFAMEEISREENVKFRDLLQEIQDRTLDTSLLHGIQLPAGSPCNNFRGYCDVFHKCRGVDADGPLARLKNLIFDPKTLQSIKDWIVIHWWAVMLMSLGLIVVMAVFIKVCAVHTPSSNPRKSKARKLTMTLRRSHRRPPRDSQTIALTSQPRRGGGGGGSGNRGGRGAVTSAVAGSSQGSSSTTAAAAEGLEGSRSAGQGHKPNAGATVAVATGAAGGSSGGAAAVIVEKIRDPPPPYSTTALLPGNSKLPPHGKGKRGKRREREAELQRL